MAREFLDKAEKRMPFPIKVFKSMADLSFFAEFEGACKQKGIKLFVLPPKSHKLNG